MGFVYCAWKDSANRMGDTGPIQEARHRLINEAGKNDEIMTGGGERDRPPLEWIVLLCASSFREEIFFSILEAWTRDEEARMDWTPIRCFRQPEDSDTSIVRKWKMTKHRPFLFNLFFQENVFIPLGRITNRSKGWRKYQRKFWLTIFYIVILSETIFSKILKVSSNIKFLFRLKASVHFHIHFRLFDFEISSKVEAFSDVDDAGAALG